MKAVQAPPNYINHICLVLDESASMTPHGPELVKVVDGQITHLAERTRVNDQETRVTVYTFNSAGTARCLIYDKDVLRVPSIAGLYHPHGLTALIDTTLLAIGDLQLTPEKYGEHSFLIYVLTDGEENQGGVPGALRRKIDDLPGHWTLATFVPNQLGVHYAKQYGFPAANISVWNADSAQGIAEVGEIIRRTSDQFMQNRTKGIRGSRSLFQVADVSKANVEQVLPALTKGSYVLANVERDIRIDEFSHDTFGKYDVGKAYYQFMKTETIQPGKAIAILTPDGEIRMGSVQQAHDLLGLPDYSLRARPATPAGYTIFVQSTSHNRKLIAGTRLLVLR